MARFWELGAGALIACAEAHQVKVPRPTLLGLAGLGGIAASVALLDGPQTPTWMMLGPVAAAAAVILSGTAGDGPVQGLCRRGPWWRSGAYRMRSICCIGR